MPNIQQTLNVKNQWYGAGNEFTDTILVNDGAFQTTGHSDNTGGNGYAVPGTGYNGYLQYLNFSMARGSSIYGKATTVQPPALCLLPQIRY